MQWLQEFHETVAAVGGTVEYLDPQVSEGQGWKCSCGLRLPLSVNGGKLYIDPIHFSSGDHAAVLFPSDCEPELDLALEPDYELEYQ